VRSALDKAIEAFGRLDIAFNSAGVEENVGTTADLKEEEWAERYSGILCAEEVNRS
jgi:NAD(P)-dependent dehydrogenase (short-subunit alcohol dehydrogenase family)